MVLRRSGRGTLSSTTGNGSEKVSMVMVVGERERRIRAV